MTRCANAMGAGVTASHLLLQSVGFYSNVSEVRMRHGARTRWVREHPHGTSSRNRLLRSNVSEVRS